MGWYPRYRPAHGDSNDVPCPYSLGRSRLGIQPFAVVASYPGDLLGYWGGNVVNVFYGTDDYVAGAELMGLSARYQLRQEIRVVGRADVVAAVSPQLAERWAGFGANPVVIPNGCWPIKVRKRAALPELKDLPQPVVGLIGQLSYRIDLLVLNAIAEAGFSLLIVGPLDPRWQQQRFKELVSRSQVYYTGPVPAEAVPSYLAAIDIGITPYRDTPFNRASFPLKTIEYPESWCLPATALTLSMSFAESRRAAVPLRRAAASPASR